MVHGAYDDADYADDDADDAADVDYGEEDHVGVG